VLTGFLGSGKTSLLRHCLRHPAFADTAIVINELGDAGLDHLLLETRAEETVVLPGGCVCCSVREDAARALDRLATRRRAGDLPPFARVIIETSGAADPVPLLGTLKADPRVTAHFRYEGMAVAIDALHGAATLARDEAARQLLYADRAILTKCDLADAGTRARTQAAVRALRPDITLLESHGEGAAATALFTGLRSDLSPPATDPLTWLGSGSHAGRFHTQSWTLDAALDWTAFGVWLSLLLDAHGSRILRVKGVLEVAGSATPVVVHGVRHTVYPPLHLPAWPPGARQSRLVFIFDGTPPARLRESLAAFQAAAADRASAPDGAALQVGSGRSVGGRARRRPTAPAWLKG
jgi:G3E family GTPase